MGAVVVCLTAVWKNPKWSGAGAEVGIGACTTRNVTLPFGDVKVGARLARLAGRAKKIEVEGGPSLVEFLASFESSPPPRRTFIRPCAGPMGSACSPAL